MKNFWIAALFMLGFFSSLSYAQTNQLSIEERGNQISFHFQWLHQGTPQSLKFALPREDLARGQTEFGRFNQDAAKGLAFEAASAVAVSLSTPVVAFKLVPHPKGYGIETLTDTGQPSAAVRMEEGKAAINRAYDKAMDQALKNAFYTRVNETHIMPDHKRIARRYAPALAPMIAQIKVATQGMSQRAQIDWILGFLQSIPYDTLMNRSTSNGSGFQTPYGLFRTNKGDCDTKSVALLAILRGLYPNLPLTMVYVPEHAFVGVGLPQGPTDYALKLGKNTYILADPTGPARAKLGEVDPRALNALKGKSYSYQVVGF